MFVFRSAEPADIERIADLNCRLAMETEEKELNLATVRLGVTRSLELSPEVRYFVAEANSMIVGQLMLTREWSDWRNGWMIWLQSVYVVAESRGHGIFSKLLNYAIEAASVDTASSGEKVVNVRLYVEHANHAAKATYGRLGFCDAGYNVMEMPVEP